MDNRYYTYTPQDNPAGGVMVVDSFNKGENNVYYMAQNQFYADALCQFLNGKTKEAISALRSRGLVHYHGFSMAIIIELAEYFYEPCHGMIKIYANKVLKQYMEMHARDFLDPYKLDTERIFIKDDKPDSPKSDLEISLKLELLNWLDEYEKRDKTYQDGFKGYVKLDPRKELGVKIDAG